MNIKTTRSYMYISRISQSQYQSLVKWASLKSLCFGFVGSNPTCDKVPVAQLVRAVVLSTIGREFNSHREQKYVNLLD